MISYRNKNPSAHFLQIMTHKSIIPMVVNEIDPIHITTIAFKENSTAYLGFFPINQWAEEIFHMCSIQIMHIEISHIYDTSPSPY